MQSGFNFQVLIALYPPLEEKVVDIRQSIFFAIDIIIHRDAKQFQLLAMIALYPPLMETAVILGNQSPSEKYSPL